MSIHVGQTYLVLEGSYVDGHGVASPSGTCPTPRGITVTWTNSWRGGGEDHEYGTWPTGTKEANHLRMCSISMGIREKAKLS